MITFSSVFLNFLSISIKVYMKYLKDFGYMSIIETITDVDNAFLSRRELTCNFAGLGGKLKKLEAVDMINKEFNLDGKVIIPIILKTQVGKSTVTGTFFVYDDEGLAKKHVNPTIFSRLEKTQAKLAEAEAAAKEAEAAAKEAEAPAEEVKAPAEEVKAPAEEAKEEKAE
jgi:ribosomal protein S24E